MRTWTTRQTWFPGALDGLLMGPRGAAAALDCGLCLDTVPSVLNRLGVQRAIATRCTKRYHAVMNWHVYGAQEDL